MYSRCTSACERGVDRALFVSREPQHGGKPCPTVLPDCGPGDGLCELITGSTTHTSGTGMQDADAAESDGSGDANEALAIGLSVGVLAVIVIVILAVVLVKKSGGDAKTAPGKGASFSYDLPGKEDPFRIEAPSTGGLVNAELSGFDRPPTADTVRIRPPGSVAPRAATIRDSILDDDTDVLQFPGAPSFLPAVRPPMQTSAEVMGALRIESNRAAMAIEHEQAKQAAMLTAKLQGRLADELIREAGETKHRDSSPVEVMVRDPSVKEERRFSETSLVRVSTPPSRHVGSLPPIFSEQTYTAQAPTLNLQESTIDDERLHLPGSPYTPGTSPAHSRRTSIV